MLTREGAHRAPGRREARSRSRTGGSEEGGSGDDDPDPATGSDGDEDPDATAVAPATWRLVKLGLTERWPDGTLDRFEIESIVPPAWLAAQRAQPGAEVAVPLDLEEMGLEPGTRATVEAIEACPAIEDGPGRVILTTVSHLNPEVVELTVADAAGRSETLEPTAGHKFFSEDRQDWVSAGELELGETLTGRDGPVAVAGLARKPGVHRVYNLTVEADHVYFAGRGRTLTHNNACSVEGANNLRRFGLEGVDLAGSSYNRGRKQLENRGFVMRDLTSKKSVASGRKEFYNPDTRTIVQYDPNDSYGGRRQQNWHIQDEAGQRYGRTGRPVDWDSGCAHIPGG